MTGKKYRGRAKFSPFPNPPPHYRSSQGCWEQFGSWAGIRFGHAKNAVLISFRETPAMIKTQHEDIADEEKVSRV